MAELTSRNEILLKTIPELDAVTAADGVGQLVIYQEGAAKNVTVDLLRDGLLTEADAVTNYVSVASQQSVSGQKTFTDTLFASNATQAIVASTPNGVRAAIDLATDGSARWSLAKSADSEAGSNAGSDLTLSRYDDTGALIDAPLTMSRSTGQITVNSDVVFNGATTIPDADDARWNADRLQGVDVDSTAPADAQVLTYVSANSRWEPKTGGLANAFILSLLQATKLVGEISEHYGTTDGPITKAVTADIEAIWFPLKSGGGGSSDNRPYIQKTEYAYYNSSTLYASVTDSALTERMFQLYEHLWAEALSSASSSRPYVLGGKGASAQADWDADKRLYMPHTTGRLLVGVGNHESLSNYGLGDAGGAETHALSVSEMPSHNHSVNDPGHSHFINNLSGINNILGADGPGGTFGDEVSGLTSGGVFGPTGRAAIGINTGVTGVSINSEGGGSAHNIRQPYMAVEYLIFAGFVDKSV